MPRDVRPAVAALRGGRQRDGLFDVPGWALVVGAVDGVGDGVPRIWPAAQRVALYAFPAVAVTDAFLARALHLDVPLLLRRTLTDQAEQAARRWMP